jgi:DNA-binding transcriptional regulator YiaG
MKKRATVGVRRKKKAPHSAVRKDARPLTASELQRMRRVALSKSIRWKLGLSQKDFAERYGFAPGTVRDWEQYRSEPDSGTKSYLEVIAADPVTVQKLRERALKQQLKAA